MAQTTVLLSECDNCGTTATTPLPASKRAALVLPQDWMHIRGDTANKTIFGIDVCPKCADGIRKSLALGKAKP